VQVVRFEAFGEPLKYEEPAIATTQDAISGWMTMAGTGLFWSLVAAIVVARAIYFSPDMIGKLWQLEALGRTARAIVGA
jgi:hypothetical protein